MERVLIAGLGDIGQGLASLLSANLYEVWGLKRNKLPAFEKLANCKLLLADLSRPESLKSIPENFDYVVYCPAPDERSETAYKSVFSDGLKNLLNHLNAACLKRFIYISSASVYAQNDGGWVDENSETNPAGFRGQILLEAENFLRLQALPSTVIRFAGLYGPGRNFMLRQVMQGKTGMSDLDAYTNRIHCDDAARMIHFLIEQERKKEIVQNIYNGVDDKPCSKRELMTWLSEEIREKFGKIISQINLPEENLEKQKLNKRCSNERIKKAGFCFNYPDYKAGYKSILEQINDMEALK